MDQARKERTVTSEEAQAKQDFYQEYRRQYAIAFGKPYPEDGGERRVGHAEARQAQTKKGTNF